MIASNEAQAALHRSVVSPLAWEAIDIARRKGAVGWKAVSYTHLPPAHMVTLTWSICWAEVAAQPPVCALGHCTPCVMLLNSTEVKSL